MKTVGILAATLLVLWFSAGCASEPPPPAVDIAAETAAIEKVLRDWSAATNRAGEAGADGYVAYATEDVVLLQPNAERVDGWQATRAFALAFTGADDWTVSWTATQIEIAGAGDVAYAIGTYEFSFKDAEGNAVADRGKFLDIFEKQRDRTWKASVISFNSDLPVGGATESDG